MTPDVRNSLEFYQLADILRACPLLINLVEVLVTFLKVLSEGRNRYSEVNSFVKDIYQAHFSLVIWVLFIGGVKNVLSFKF